MQITPDPYNSTISTENCFNMWRDYMGLSGLVLRLWATRDEETQEEPKKKAPGPRGRSRTSSTISTSDSSSCGSISGKFSDYCRLCKQNGETPIVFRSHRLKTDEGKVVCPILRSYTCPICGATGDSAHTRRYCPKAKRQGIKPSCMDNTR